MTSLPKIRPTLPPAVHAAAGRSALLLFDHDWDRPGFRRQASRFDFRRDGFDLFSFPSNLHLLRFDIQRFVARLAARHGRRIDGVVSHNEQYGALAAALVAERLGLPGATPEAVVACQHKLHFRRVLERVAPEASLGHRLLPCEGGSASRADLAFPVFVKPIKATYSVMARRIDSLPDLQSHLDLGWSERWIIRRLIKPFDDVARARLDLRVGAWNMLAEEVCTWPQFNLDGWVRDGRTHLLGVVDETMFPGTHAFARFSYPSRLPARVQRRALDIADRFLTAVGFRSGFFNMEFFYDAASGGLKVIEFNPRLASQLADLYLRVDGVDPHAMSLELALGGSVTDAPRRPPRGGAAASFVFRTFDATPPHRPDDAALSRLATTFPDALLLSFHKRGAGLRRELKWLGSHRYGVLNMHGDDERDLHRRYGRACEILGWPARR